MAVTLVSTGVQFPDNSIQTTAASASPWVIISNTTVSSAVAQIAVTINTSLYSAFQLFCSFPQSSSGQNIGFQTSNNGGSTYSTGGYILNGEGGRNMFTICGSQSDQNASGFCFFYVGPNGAYTSGFRQNTYGASSGGAFGAAISTANINALRFITGNDSGQAPNGNLTAGTYVVLGLRRP
jgi:hypothetical protein